MQKSLAMHKTAATALLETIATVPDSRWNVPVAEGKWTPAEIAAHLVATYDIVTQELKGGPGMAIRLKPWQQVVAKLMYGWRIVYFGAFPKNAPAPRETRPPAGLAKDAAIEAFRRKSEEFEAAANAAPPGRQLSHAYFGKGPAAQGVVICARHIEHHRRQLASASV